ncbi:MAG: CBS domain-containing protein [Bacteroidetes bacterium]|jgi:Zn-dependent protease|nr:CBS domain-containing protein [Bacteroidota bacterium]
MSASLKIGRFAGIRVQIHWTFWLLFLFVGFLVWNQGGSSSDLLWHSLFIVGIFTCVVFHEFGHALTAKKFGIDTRSITLLPIGGVASLKNLPDDPIQEFLVAVAGPAVNVVIAFLLYFFIPIETYTGMSPEVMQEELSMIDQGNFLFYLFMANVALVLFNILPAFPMDGGRIFRALLATQMPRTRATSIAASTGKFLAMIFFLIGIFYNIILAIIAVFIWFGAHSENIMVQQMQILKGFTIRDAMLSEYTVLNPDDSLKRAVDQILASTEQHFVVADGNTIHGILYMSDLSKALQSSGEDTQVRKVMDTNVKKLEADDPLKNVYREIKRDNRNFFPVMKNDEMVGVLDMNNINEFLTFHAALDY